MTIIYNYLEGAIQNIRWHDLSEYGKNNLKEFYKKIENKK